MVYSNYENNEIFWAYATSNGRVGYHGSNYVFENEQKHLEQISIVDGPKFPQKMGSAELTRFFNATFPTLTRIGDSLKLTVHAKGRGGIIDRGIRECAQALGIHDPLVDDRQVEINLENALVRSFSSTAWASNRPSIFASVKVKSINYFPIVENGDIIGREEHSPTREIKFTYPAIAPWRNGPVREDPTNGIFAVRGLLGSSDERDKEHVRSICYISSKITLYLKTTLEQMEFIPQYSYVFETINNNLKPAVEKVAIIGGLILTVKLPIIFIPLWSYHFLVKPLYTALTDQATVSDVTDETTVTTTQTTGT